MRRKALIEFNCDNPTSKYATYDRLKAEIDSRKVEKYLFRASRLIAQERWARERDASVKESRRIMERKKWKNTEMKKKKGWYRKLWFWLKY
jgi:hypothetical protein